jgi:hypothetical protein
MQIKMVQLQLINTLKIDNLDKLIERLNERIGLTK